MSAAVRRTQADSKYNMARRSKNSDIYVALSDFDGQQALSRHLVVRETAVEDNGKKPLEYTKDWHIYKGPFNNNPDCMLFAGRSHPGA